MGALVVQVLLALPLTVYILALVWTGPGPNQQRRGTILAWVAASVLFLAAVSLIGGGVMENVSQTPESEESQWGTGWAFLAIIVTLPLFVLSVALLGVAFTTGKELGTRVAVSMAAGAGIGLPLFWGVAWIAFVQVEERL